MGTSAQDSTPARRSGPISLWAIASVVCSGLLCPPLCLLGPLLGVVGLYQTRTEGRQTGRRLAWTGIALGLVATVFWAITGVWWHVNVRRPMLDGPREVLAAGLAGDVDGFMDGFHLDGPPPSRVEAAAFLEEIRLRYGAIQRLEPDPDAPASAPPTDTRRWRIPYRMRSEGGMVRLDAVFVRSAGPGFLPMILKWGALAVRDPERGDLLYPSTASELASASELSPSEPEPANE